MLKGHSTHVISDLTGFGIRIILTGNLHVPLLEPD